MCVRVFSVLLMILNYNFNFLLVAPASKTLLLLLLLLSFVVADVVETNAVVAAGVLLLLLHQLFDVALLALANSSDARGFGQVSTCNGKRRTLIG